MDHIWSLHFESAMHTNELMTSFAASKNLYDMKIFGTITLLFILAGCSSLKVNSDYDKSLDFNSYRSFSFLEWSKENISLIGDFDAQRIINGVKAQMLDRGYAYKEIGGDLSISLYVVVSQETATSSYSTYYGGYYGGYAYNPGWGWGGGYTATTYSSQDYINGTLVIDIFDEKTKDLAWQVVGSGTVESDPERRERNTERVMSYLFKDFPKEKIKD